MRVAERIWRAGLGGGKAALVGGLCVGMAVPPGVRAQQMGGAKLPVEKHPKALTEQEKVLQALNRFTFGPRPGDVAAVETMGLQQWFELQLHPERIDDSGFGVEMGEFPAMGLPEAELKERFPSGQVIRLRSKQGGSVPGDPVERAIYADASYADGERLRGVGTQDSVTDSDGTPVISAEQVEAVLRLGAEERFGRLVGMAPEEMLGFREAVKGKDRVRLVAGMSAAQREAVEAMVESPERVVATEDAEMRLLRDIDSKRQLQAVMTEFWLNHFNVYLRKSEEEPYLLPEYAQDAILPHALGRFEDLLVATAKSPAMLMYLDNWESIGPGSYADGGRLRVVGVQAVAAGQPLKAKVPKGINENYGRELMELHTLGVGGGYTQQDVIEVAKCFTGWTIDRPYGGGGGKGQMMDTATPGQFVFDPRRHEPGPKVVLGHTIPEGGMEEGLEVLHILATSPATAHFISQELAVRFVSDTPPPVLVNRMTAAYLKSDGDIRAVLTAMFKAKEFWAPQVYRAKVKTPLEFLTSAVRASDATVMNPLPLVQAMDRLGMPVWGMPTPNGYGWTAEDWVSSNGLLSRMNFALVLSGNRVPGTKTDWAGMLGSGDASAGMERELEGDLLGQAASVRTRAAVARPGKPSEVPLDTMAGLLMGSPEFQRR